LIGDVNKICIHNKPYDLPNISRRHRVICTPVC